MLRRRCLRRPRSLSLGVGERGCTVGVRRLPGRVVWVGVPYLGLRANNCDLDRVFVAYRQIVHRGAASGRLFVCSVGAECSQFDGLVMCHTIFLNQVKRNRVVFIPVASGLYQTLFPTGAGRPSSSAMVHVCFLRREGFFPTIQAPHVGGRGREGLSFRDFKDCCLSVVRCRERGEGTLSYLWVGDAFLRVVVGAHHARCANPGRGASYFCPVLRFRFRFRFRFSSLREWRSFRRVAVFTT